MPALKVYQELRGLGPEWKLLAELDQLLSLIFVSHQTKCQKWYLLCTISLTPATQKWEGGSTDQLVSQSWIPLPPLTILALSNFPDLGNRHQNSSICPSQWMAWVWSLVLIKHEGSWSLLTIDCLTPVSLHCFHLKSILLNWLPSWPISDGVTLLKSFLPSKT